MDKEKIERINYLAHKSKTGVLSDEEKNEQQILRNEYREYMIRDFKKSLSNTYVIDKNGKKRKVIEYE